MKIGEAQRTYREQIKEYQSQKAVLSKQLKELYTRMAHSPDKKEQYASEAATLELTLDALNEKQTEYQDYLNQLSEQYLAYWNASAAEQQTDAAAEYTAEVSKILEVARRIMRGAIVPASDEKKLLEFSPEMYQTAKSIGAMVRRNKKEKYDSLWKEKTEKEYEDPKEAAENAEAASFGPPITDAAEITASVGKASV